MTVAAHLHLVKHGEAISVDVPKAWTMLFQVTELAETIADHLDEAGS